MLGGLIGVSIMGRLIGRPMMDTHRWALAQLGLVFIRNQVSPGKALWKDEFTFAAETTNDCSAAKKQKLDLRLLEAFHPSGSQVLSDVFVSLKRQCM